MKELSVEEKAKRYDEALEWMRDLYPSMSGAMKEDAEHYFPGIAESEDERIRKDIIHHIEFDRDHYVISQQRAESWIAWVEKRGEQKPAWSEEDEMRIDNLIAIIEHRGYPDYVEYLEKLKDRHTWKPSDEQMEALRIARDRNDRIGFYLSQLYDDLKKFT